LVISLLENSKYIIINYKNNTLYSYFKYNSSNKIINKSQKKYVKYFLFKFFEKENFLKINFLKEE